MTQNQSENKTLHMTMKAKSRTNKPEYLSALKHKKALGLDEKKLHRTVATNNTEALSELLASGANPNASDGLLRSPLHLAASRGYKEVISLLIKYGADPNQKDIIGNTALHLAACTNNIEIVTLLLDAGTDVSSLDLFGRNPLQLAQSKLKLLQNSRRQSAVELINLRLQLQQVIDLMLSFLRRQQGDVAQLEKIKVKIGETSDCQLDDQVEESTNSEERISKSYDLFLDQIMLQSIRSSIRRHLH